MNKKYKWLLRQALRFREVRIFLYEIMRTCQIFQHGFVPGDPHATSFHCGQRSIGIMLYDFIMQIDPKLLIQAKDEHTEFFADKKDENLEERN